MRQGSRSSSWSVNFLALPACLLHGAEWPSIVLANPTDTKVKIPAHGSCPECMHTHTSLKEMGGPLRIP